MSRCNQLFFIVFTLALLAGCGTPHHREDPRLAGVHESDAPVSALAGQDSRSASPRDTEMLIRALATAGTSYRFGGKSYENGFDCSGLVAFVYREAYGLILPHSTDAQSAMGEPVGTSELRPGDLVFFNTLRRPHSHVGIYLGDGKFIHAPKTGAVVRTERLGSSYWAARFDGARRLAPRVGIADLPAPLE